MALETFTTETLTRADAGFTNNADVTAPTITIYVEAANGEVNTALAGRYNLPLSNNANYSGSQTEDYLEQLATNLAAGLLMLKQYEGQGGVMADLAEAKIAEARSQLEQIQNAERILIGTDGIEFDLRDAARASIDGFPNDSTTTPSVFDMDDKF